MKRNDHISPDWWIVRIDESRYCRADILEKVGKLWGVYLYDANEQTFLCSATPNHFLRFLAYEADVYPPDEDGAEVVFELLIDMVDGDEDYYISCSQLKALPPEQKRLCYTKRDAPKWSYEDDGDERGMDDAMEYFNQGGGF